jgi:hypothetical protein
MWSTFAPYTIILHLTYQAAALSGLGDGEINVTLFLSITLSTHNKDN